MPYDIIADFRSDTVTRPTKAMYDAICNAKLGDDGFSDDPTVIALEEKCAGLSGKAKALFFPSGIMANQTAIRVFCDPGQEIILEEDSHMFNYEKGALAYAMIQTRTVKGVHGVIKISDVKKRIKKASKYQPGTALLCIENPHNMSGGTIIDQQHVMDLCDIAHQNEVPVYMDGARLFNAQIASGIPFKELAAPVDALMFCLSKSLGAPAGSVLCGDRLFIEKARGVRQYLGGTMRQSGILAACGLEALRLENINRLAEDHERTQLLAQSLSALPYFSLPNPRITINMFYLSIDEHAPFDSHQLVKDAKSENILLLAPNARTLRIMCHKDINDQDVKHLVSFLQNYTIKYETTGK
ncbi:MAG: aminotransferase class I/II-fold pyridoxal phosphate-dependent enzyme [Flavobacteriaceae bacterium]|nr:MAG: aminotransferase class I/II-fold pyridoxal phosphate-dependent enzyme [Flavobacteriaceae bacterium]